MSRLEIILIVLLVIILLAYLSFVGFIIYSIRKERKNDKSSVPVQVSKVDLISPWQTDFYNQSIEYAEKILFGKEFIKEYGQQGYYGNKLLDVTNMLNADTKKSVIIAIKSTCLEPGSCRENERITRLMAEQEGVPLWFFILREGMKKVVPSMFIQSEDQSNTMNSGKDNIISLYQRTG